MSHVLSLPPNRRDSSLLRQVQTQLGSLTIGAVLKIKRWP